MTDEQKPAAWAATVLTERLGGGPLMTVVYAVLASSRDEAIGLVQSQRWFIPGEEVGEVARLSAITTEALGLRPGEVRML